jgi:hypothetical protein
MISSALHDVFLQLELLASVHGLLAFVEATLGDLVDYDCHDDEE